MKTHDRNMLTTQFQFYEAEMSIEDGYDEVICKVQQLRCCVYYVVFYNPEIAMSEINCVQKKVQKVFRS